VEQPGRRALAAHQASHRTPPRPARPPPRRTANPGSLREGRYRLVDPVRVAHGKAAEYQARGAVHFHALLRLDGYDLAQPGQILSPPTCITIVDLDDAVRQAVTGTSFRTDSHPAQPGGWLIAWGDQLDIRVITLDGTGAVTDLAVASYLAKYSTKGTEVTGHASARITPDTLDLYASASGTHTERLIDACWKIGQHPDHARLRRWAHMLGFGGHFLTKARRYSIRFGDLRQARIRYRRGQDTGPDHGPIRTADHTDDEASLEPAGVPLETPCSPTLPQTRPANAAKPDATSSTTNTTAHQPAVRPHNSFAAY
jgi:hypothetical protein